MLLSKPTQSSWPTIKDPSIIEKYVPGQASTLSQLQNKTKRTMSVLYTKRITNIFTESTPVPSTQCAIFHAQFLYRSFVYTSQDQVRSKTRTRAILPAVCLAPKQYKNGKKGLFYFLICWSITVAYLALLQHLSFSFSPPAQFNVSTHWSYNKTCPRDVCKNDANRLAHLST